MYRLHEATASLTGLCVADQKSPDAGGLPPIAPDWIRAGEGRSPAGNRYEGPHQAFRTSGSASCSIVRWRSYRPLVTTAAVTTAAVKTAAVKTAAVKTAAVKTAAVKTAAVKTAAVKTAAVKTAAVKTAAVLTVAVLTVAESFSSASLAPKLEDRKSPGLSGSPVLLPVLLDLLVLLDLPDQPDLPASGSARSKYHVVVPIVPHCSLFAVRCSLFAVRCSLFAVRCSLFDCSTALESTACGSLFLLLEFWSFHCGRQPSIVREIFAEQNPNIKGFRDAPIFNINVCY